MNIFSIVAALTLALTVSACTTTNYGESTHSPDTLVTNDSAQDTLIIVNLSTQTLTLFQYGEAIETFAVSTAKVGKVTPVGEFTVDNKDIDHRSNLYCKRSAGTKGAYSYKKKPSKACKRGYEGYPMFYALHLAGPIWIHVGKLPENPIAYTGLSSGCIRVDEETGKLLFTLVQLGTKVIVQ